MPDLKFDSNVANEIEKVGNALQKLPTKELETASNKASKSLGQIVAETREMPKSVEKAAVSIDYLTSSAAKIDYFQKELLKAKISLKELADSGEDYENPQVRKLISQIETLDGKLKKLSGQEKKLDSVNKATNKSFEKQHKLLTRIKDAIQFTVIYRVLGSMFQSLVKSMQEGTQNAYQFSKAINGTFATSMDKIATSTTYLKNSLGAIGSTIINAFQPALTWLQDNLADVFNFISVVIGKLSGESSVLQAKKSLSEYAEATDTATKSNDNFKKSLAGFDELNNISSSASSAAAGQKGANVSDMFYDKDISKMTWADIGNMAGFQKTLDGLKTIGLSLAGIGIIFGKTKLSAIGLAIDAIAGIVEDIHSIKTDGANFDNITGLIHDLSELAFAITAFSGDLKAMGITGAITIITDFIHQAPAIWKGITEGDWSNIDWGNVVSDAVIGIILISKGISNFKKNKAVKEVAESTGDVSAATEGVANSTGTFSKGLVKVAKNMLLGIAILGEVIFAAGMFVAGIWGIGLLLQQVVEAWKPVIENKDIVNAAMLQGTAIFALVGVAVGLLGLVGTPLIVALGLGIAVLAEISIATDLFLGEILIIGKLLQKIVTAWAPVLANGDIVNAAIKKGSTLLLAIGVVTAALGVLAVASVGLLPLAIGLGTAMLVELSLAVVAFVDSLALVAYQIADVLSPSLEHLNPVLPETDSNLKHFNKFMKQIAITTVEFAKDSVVAGLAGAVSKVTEFFVGNPIENMAKSVNKNGSHAKTLNSNLTVVNPDLYKAVWLLQEYNLLLNKISVLTGQNQNINLQKLNENMKDVGKNIVVGLVEGLKSKVNSLNNALNEVFADVFSTKKANDYGFSFGKSIAQGLSDGFKSAKFPKLSGAINTKLNNRVELELKAYAGGGLVESGQVFIANERGPELVGSIGRQTAVANQNQIVQAVSIGVYDAVVEAINKSNNGGDNRPIIVQINGREVFHTVQDESAAYYKRTGQPAF